MNGFKILNKIGEGSFSTVLKVQRKKDGIIYALKKVKFSKLNEKEKSNALNEIRILASINNKNIISYKEAFFDENDSSLDIVMEYADQGDLFQLITEHKKTKTHFSEEFIWNTLTQLLNGLKTLHELNILHRDLKSANVFLFKNGVVKLGDLNVSKITRKGMGYTQTGTPYYASPEVWKDKPYDSKSDIWSLGCVIYEMCALNPPFRAQTMEELFKRVVRGYYPDISNRYSKDLSEILKLMIQTEVGARPSCDELLNMPIIKKRIDYFNNKNNLSDEIKEENEKLHKELLSTIKIPKNMSNLSRNLPKPNYVSNSFDLDNSVINNNNIINNKFGQINNIKNILLNMANNNNRKITNLNNISSINRNNISIKYKLNSKIEDILLKNNKNKDNPINNNCINSSMNKKKNSLASPMSRMQKQKSNIALGRKVILPELRIKKKNINYNLKNISIINNNMNNKDSNRLMQIRNNSNKHLMLNKYYNNNLGIRDNNYKQSNDNFEQKKSDNYNYQNLKVVNLNIIDNKKYNIKKSFFREVSPIAINRNYIDNDKILKIGNKYRYNNNKLGSMPKKNIILNINL